MRLKAQRGTGVKAIDFYESNAVLRAPIGSEDVSDLPIHRHDEGVISCWQIGWRDIAKIVWTRKIYLSVRGSTHPPLVLVVNAFESVSEEAR